MGSVRMTSRKAWCMGWSGFLLAVWAGGVPTVAWAQEAAAPAVARIVDQDPDLDNLVDPPGYETAELGTLGGMTRSGSGPRPMILIPGLGFGGDVFEGFMEGREEAFTRYAVTLPGMGGTQAPPAPLEGVSFGEQSWTNAAVQAIEGLLEAEALDDVVLVGHWLTGTQIALRIALAHPERVSAVILLAGSPRWVPPVPTPERPDSVPLPERIAGVDGYLAPQWFRTVTRETWDDNNFLPGDYAVHPVMGLRLWREAAQPPLHVWIRYLNEFFAQDALLDLPRIEAPVLLLKPGLEGVNFRESRDYLRAYTDRSWGAWTNGGPSLSVRTIPDARVVPWADQPQLVDEAVEDFLGLAPGEPDVEAGDTLWFFRGVRVFDGHSVRSPTNVLVAGGRIAAMGSSVSPPAGARTVPGEGRTLLPGLIDAHTHTFMPEALESALRFGVTSVLDQFTLPSTVAQVRDAEEEGRARDRASLFTSGIVATAPGGHPTQGGLDIPVLTSPEEAGAFVRERANEGSEWLKIVWDDGATHGFSLPTLNEATVQALIEAAHAEGLQALVHVATGEHAVAALEMGADGLVHTVQQADLPDDFATRVAATGGFVVPTLTVIRSVSGEPEGAAQLEHPSLAGRITDAERPSLGVQLTPRTGATSSGRVAMESVRALHEAGVVVLAGTDAPNPGTAFGVTLHRELELLVRAGLTPSEALASATGGTAEAFGLDDRGHIAPGFRADLLLVEGDPTRDILATRNIVGVWKGGELASSLR